MIGSWPTKPHPLSWNYMSLIFLLFKKFYHAVSEEMEQCVATYLRSSRVSENLQEKL
jgi:hypothetical protein